MVALKAPTALRGQLQFVVLSVICFQVIKTVQVKSEVSILGPKAVQCVFLWLKNKQNPPSSNLVINASSTGKTSYASVAAVAFSVGASQFY